MKKQFYVLSIVMVSFAFQLVPFKSYAQLGRGDVFSLDYTFALMGNDNIDFYKTDFKTRFPVKFKKGILFNSVGLEHYQLNYDNFNFNTSDIEKFYNLNYSSMLIYPLSGKWSVAASAGISISSNLTSSISTEDLLINGGLLASKNGGTKDKPSKLMFGLIYSTRTGEPLVLSMISYIKQVNNKFSYGIGFPNIFAKYALNEKHSFVASIWMNGFYANLSDPVLVEANNLTNKASFTSVSLGVAYNYWIGNFWAITFKGGYSLINNYELRDSSENTVYDFNTSSKPYFSTGIKFNILNKRKNKKPNDNQWQN